MPLNIDLQQIFLHLFNFTLLFGILYFLLYSPVKNFMAKREGYYADMEKEANANLESAIKEKEVINNEKYNTGISFEENR